MDLSGVGLVLEGGGMRGVFTGGVLDFFLEQELTFPYVIGVSAGACNAASYISRQKGRNKKVNIGFIRDPRYLSWRNLWREKSVFGMDFIFRDIPALVPFDFATFHASRQTYVIGATDCQSGQAIYFEKNDFGADLLTILRASSSIPFLSATVSYQGRDLLDGGVAAPIPLAKAIEDGYRRNVIILTRDIRYRKSPLKAIWLAKRFYPRYPELVKRLEDRYRLYNRWVEEIIRLEGEGQVFVIRPQQKLKVKRMERNEKKLTELYEEGYRTAARQHEELRRWLTASPTGK